MVAVYDPIPRTDSDVVLIGGDWNHGILFSSPFSWECHHPN